MSLSMRDIHQMAEVPARLQARLKAKFPEAFKHEEWAAALGAEVPTVEPRDLRDTVLTAAAVTQGYYLDEIQALNMRIEQLMKPHTVHIHLVKGGFWTWLMTRKVKSESK